MKLNELIQAVPGLARLPSAAGEGDELDISMVTDDSRRVTPGALFVARPGAKGDGADFVMDAISRGATAIVALPSVIAALANACAALANARAAPKQAAQEDPRVRGIACEHPARAAALLTHAFAGWPARSLKLAAVTGTNGKTTVSTLLRQLLNATGTRCGLIGTVEVHDGRLSTPASLTTPGAEQIVRACAAMVANGCGAAAMETSSHALDQERTAGLDFEVGIFTNLTGDHLDYHRTMENYAAAKAKLFESLSTSAVAIVNAMDPAHERMLRDCSARVIRCVIDGGATSNARSQHTAPVIGASQIIEASATIHSTALSGASITFQGPWGALRADVALAGRHNAMNVLQAIAAAHAMGVTPGALEAAVRGLRAPPGRLEPVTAQDAPFQVLVDYAHSDDALSNVLTALRPLVGEQGRVIAVFGCGGDRDPLKRPRMAAVACRGAEVIFVTSDNPRTEEPESIIDAIMDGVEAHDRSRVRRDADRASAIHAAIAEARPGDVVLIAGKGHEDYQIIGTVKRHFDDREQARAALESLAAAGSAP